MPRLSVRICSRCWEAFDARMDSKNFTCPKCEDEMSKALKKAAPVSWAEQLRSARKATKGLGK